MPRAHKEQPRKEERHPLLERSIAFWERHRLPLIIIAIGIAVLIVLLSITKSYLAIQFLLGNDLLVEAIGENTSVSVAAGTRVTLPLSVAVTANPFCESACTAILRDVSTGDELYAETFEIRTGDPYSTTREISTPARGAGQALYRHEITCAATPSAWCHTGGVAVTRDLLITIDYGPTPEQLAKRAQLKTELLAIAASAAQARARNTALATDLAALNATIDADSALAQLAQAQAETDQLDATLTRAQAYWNDEDDVALAQAASEAQGLLAQAAVSGDAVSNMTAQLIAHQNTVANGLNAIHTTLLDIASVPTANVTLQSDRSTAIVAYTATQSLLTGSRNNALVRENALSTLATTITSLASAFEAENSDGALTLDAKAALVLDALCTAGVSCVIHPMIPTLANTTALDQTISCTRINNASITLALIRASLEQEAQDDNISGNATLTALAQAQASERYRLERDTALTALASIPGAPHTAQLTTILIAQPTNAPIALNDTGIEPLVGIALIDMYPLMCAAPPNITFPTPSITPYSSTPIPVTNGTITLPDTVPQCCVLGECRACCDDSACRGAIEPPIIFIHGHAFNQGTSAEYSLDAFDLIQRHLESDGWLDTGTIALSDEVRANSWTRAGVPISTKASYYLDVYAGADNAVLVQTKSESIDTYVLKLNDIIEETRRRTGQDKVIIVAHSMGSFATQQFLLDHAGDVDAVALTGTAALDLLEPALDLSGDVDLSAFNTPSSRRARTTTGFLATTRSSMHTSQIPCAGSVSTPNRRGRCSPVPAEPPTATS